MYRLIASLLLCCAAPIQGAPNDAEAFLQAGIEPVVSPDDFRSFMADLQLGREERDAADLLLEDYARGMHQVLTDLHSQQEQDRQRLDAALDGRSRLTADAIRELRLSLRVAVQNSWKIADERLREMVEWATLLSRRDAAAQSWAIGRLHRRVYLTGTGRAGLVDVGELVAEAEELDELDDAAVRMALATYDRSIAATAMDDALAVRRARITDAMASLRKDTTARASLQRESAERWRIRMAIQDAAIAAVHRLLKSSGDEASRKWTDRVNAAFFPSVCGRLDAVIAADWVAKNGDAAQAAQVRTCISDSTADLRMLRSEAVALLREGREIGVDLDHDAASLVSEAMDVRMRYLRNSGERSILEREMYDCVVRSLSDGQRAAIRRILAVGR